LVSKKDISFCFRLISLIQSDFLSFNETIVLSLRLLVFLNSLRKTSHQGTADGAGCFKPRGAVPNHEGGGGGGRGTLSGPQGSDPDKNGEICKNSTEFTELTQEQ
jgi:hypothetical protein